MDPESLREVWVVGKSWLDSGRRHTQRGPAPGCLGGESTGPRDRFLKRTMQGFLTPVPVMVSGCEIRG